VEQRRSCLSWETRKYRQYAIFRTSNYVDLPPLSSQETHELKRETVIASRWTVAPTVNRERQHMSEKKVTQYRSAKTGEFVTKNYAEKNKDTTVKERNSAPRPPQPKTRGK
jgi:hypothetical protein